MARLTAEYQEFEDAVTTLQVDFAAAEAENRQGEEQDRKGQGGKGKDQDREGWRSPARNSPSGTSRSPRSVNWPQEDRHAIETTAQELVALYADPVELGKHARVVDMDEIEENECNLNIPRFVDTFEPEEPIDVKRY